MSAVAPANTGSAVPVLLRGGPALARWTLEGGQASRAPRAWRLQLRWHAWWFDRLRRLQLPRLPDARPLRDPILVLGLWRSGTTLLHQRLAALPDHQAPQTWQCFNPAAFALMGAAHGDLRTVRRPMDGGEVRADTPQEDEFALLLQGAPSLYRGFIDPRRLDALAQEHFDTAGSDDAWTADWLRFLAGVEAAGARRRLVLKSPNHTLRLGALQAVLPNSPQVWIGRPLPDVWSSNLRMWRAMFTHYGLWPCPQQMLERFLLRCMQRYIAMLRQALNARDPRHTMWVDFDDLAVQPLPLLQTLWHFVGATVAADTPHLQSRILQQHPTHEATTAAQLLPAPAIEAHVAIEALHAQARARWGWRLQHCGLPA